LIILHEFVTVLHQLITTSIDNRFFWFKEKSTNQKKATKILFSDWLCQNLQENLSNFMKNGGVLQNFEILVILGIIFEKF
jgi:hypothetical protein